MPAIIPILFICLPPNEVVQVGGSVVQGALPGAMCASMPCKDFARRQITTARSTSEATSGTIPAPYRGTKIA
jgi:hypothetical protein